MSRMDERAVARKLAERDDIEPPAGLLEKIRSEIPDEIRVSPELARSSGVAPEDAAMPRRQRWLIAASLVAALGAGVLGWELRGRAPSMGAVAMEEREAVAAPRDAAGDEVPLALKQAPTAPAAPPMVPNNAPEAEVQAEDLSEAGQEEPQSTAPKAAAGRAPGSPQSLEGRRRDEPQDREMESQVEALPVSPSETRQRLERPARGLLPPPPTAPAAAPPAPPTAQSSEAPEGFVVSEEITVTGVASDASSSMGSTVVSRRPGGRWSDAFITTEEAPLSTFRLDVGTASYEVARHSLGDGELPDPASVRVEEWVSYFHYGDRAPVRADFSVTTEGAPTPFTPGPRYRLVRFNIRGREVEPGNRVIARDAAAQVMWNPTVVESYRLLRHESRDMAETRARRGAEIGAGHSMTALYEVKLRQGVVMEPDRRLATLRLRWRSPETGRVAETGTPLMGFHLANGWEAASPALRLAAVVAEMAEILKGSYWAEGGSLDTVFLEAQKVGAQFPGKAEVAEFVSLAGKAARLKGMAAAEPR